MKWKQRFSLDLRPVEARLKELKEIYISFALIFPFLLDETCSVSDSFFSFILVKNWEAEKSEFTMGKGKRWREMTFVAVPQLLL